MACSALVRVLLPTLVVVLIALGGCSTTPPGGSQREAGSEEASASDKSRDGAAVVQGLLDQHREWEGTPYLYGGSSRAGVDCSAFVQTTYATRLSRSLPRTTRAQARVGTRVEQEAVRPGDLVFFRPGNKKRHVGIYVDNGRFLHASTSQGVTLSELDNPYWRNAYWMARRP